ncbi:unnamed protein product, partial [Brenthis ino]
MVSKCKVLLVVLVFTKASSDNIRGKSGKRKQHLYSNDNIWKKVYETELDDAFLVSDRDKNFTRAAQSTSTSDNEVVIEKLMEAITANEKYLKKIENIDFKLNRLDIEIHERTNAILKRLTEVTTTVHSPGDSKKYNASWDDLKTDISQIKLSLEKYQRHSVDNKECSLEVNLDSRLSFLESHMKSVMNSVDTIANVIAEVKNRQRTRNSNKPEVNGAIDPSFLINEFRRVIHEQKTKKCDCKSGRVDRAERYPTDCQEIQTQGFNITGIYKIKPDEMEPFYVLCDLNAAGGGWTVIQNRFDGSQDFFKNWYEYKHGFGNLAGEFWLGLEKIYYLTNQKLYELRVEIESQHGQEASGTYSVFTLGPEYEGYRISTIGTFRGTAGDSLSYHAGQKFSTYDVDNDEWKEGSCANEHGGAWWYKECDKSNLNGKYLISPDESNEQSIYWVSFKGSHSPLYKTRMMIRPLPASRPMEYNERILSTKLSIDKNRGKDTKSSYHEAVRGRLPYRFDDGLHADGFFPNYA